MVDVRTWSEELREEIEELGMVEVRQEEGESIFMCVYLVHSKVNENLTMDQAVQAGGITKYVPSLRSRDLADPFAGPESLPPHHQPQSQLVQRP